MSLACVAVLCIVRAIADTTAVDSLPLADVQEFLEGLQDEAGGQDLLDALLWRRNHPFDLNRISTAELLSIPFVTDAEAGAVIRYRDSVGRFATPGELRTMPGGGESVYRVLSPFVFIGRTESPLETRRVVTLRSRMDVREPFQAGAIGSPVRAYARFRAVPIAGIEAGGLFERDAGELSRDAFTSGYLWMRKLIPGTEILVGDFSVEAGQGLVLWRGSSVSKSAWSVSGPRKTPLGIIPHRSTDEIRFFRGAAISTELTSGQDRWSGMVFLSRRYLPGGVAESGEFSSISQTSAFTTASSASRKDALRVDTQGGRVTYGRGEMVSAGMTYISSRFGNALRHDDPLRFAGEKFQAAGCDVRISLQPFLLVAELARGSNQVALVAGASIEASPRLAALLIFRHYAPGYDNLYANGFGDNGDTRNEQGAYVGLAVRPLPWLSMHLYCDQFRHPGPGSLTRFPGSGSEVMVDASASISRNVDMCARWTAKSTTTSIAMPDERGRESRGEGIRHQVRWRLSPSVRFNARYEFRTRCEYTRVSLRPGNDERGYLIGGEIKARPFRFVHITARLFFFDTDAYESRLYAFESDLPGAFASTPLYGTGRRWVVTIGLDPSAWCTLSLAIDATEKEPDVSSGSSMRENPFFRQSHAGLQFDLRF